MKKFKSIISVILVAMLAVSAVGCGAGSTTSEYWEDEVITVSGENTGTDDNTGDCTASGGSGGGTATVSKKVNGSTGTGDGGQQGQTGQQGGSYDMNGATVTIAGWGSGDGSPSPTSKTYKQEMALKESVEKKYNCKIKYYNSSESLFLFDEFSTATMAGQKFCDIIIMTSDQFFPQAAVKGYLTQLDNYIDVNSTQWVEKVTAATTLNGKHYFVTSPALAGEMAGGGIIFNKQIFKDFSLQNPYDYIDQGNWKWDSFRQLAIDCTRKVGDVQYYGFGSNSPSTWIGTNGVLSSVWKDNKVVFNLDNPETYQALDFAWNLFHTDNVIPASGGSNLFLNGQVAMLASSWYGTPTYIEKLGENMGYAYSPYGPAVNDYQYKGAGTALVGIPSTVKDPAPVGQVLSEMFGTYKWSKTLEEMYEPFVADERGMQIMVDCATRGMLNCQLTGYYSWYNRNVLWTDFHISANDMSTKAFVESVKARSQEEIDSIWDGYASF